jgi:predicted outer membrane protein
MRIRSTRAALGFVLVMTAGAMCVHAQGYGTASGEKKQKTPPAHADARLFIKDMTIAGLAEIELGKVAAQKAADPEVRAFGEAMVKDHTEANEKLATIASQLNVSPPTQLDKKHQELVAKLSMLEGATFDREYMTAMAHGHEEDIFNLKARTGPTQRVSDPASGTPNVPSTGSTAARGPGERVLDAWATERTPVVQKDLERARTILKELK